MHRLVPVLLLLLLLACLLDIFQAVPAGRATRSTPSAVVRVVTLDPNPPAPPADVAATGSSAGTDLTVTWRATAPDGPAGRFWFEVLNPAGPFTLLRQEATALRNPAEPTRFSATMLNREEATEVAVVVIDPTGRRATSASAPYTDLSDGSCTSYKCIS
jgi:hypothetical protein